MRSEDPRNSRKTLQLPSLMGKPQFLSSLRATLESRSFHAGCTKCFWTQKRFRGLDEVRRPQKLAQNPAVTLPDCKTTLFVLSSGYIGVPELSRGVYQVFLDSEEVQGPR